MWLAVLTEVLFDGTRLRSGPVYHTVDKIVSGLGVGIVGVNRPRNNSMGRSQGWSFGAYWHVPGVCTTTVKRPTGGRRGLGMIVRDPCPWRIRGPCRPAGHDPGSDFFQNPPAALCPACLSRGGQRLTCP